MDRLLGIRDAIVAAGAPLEADDLEVASAGGRYLAAPALARVPAPAHTCSAVDGYAIRAAEAPAPCALPVAFAIHAGDAPPRPLAPAEAARSSPAVRYPRARR